jgi:hypothetical protein
VEVKAKKETSSSSDWQARSLNEKGVRVCQRWCDTGDTVVLSISKPRDPRPRFKNMDNLEVTVVT